MYLLLLYPTYRTSLLNVSNSLRLKSGLCKTYQSSGKSTCMDFFFYRFHLLSQILFVAHFYVLLIYLSISHCSINFSMPQKSLYLFYWHASIYCFCCHCLPESMRMNFVDISTFSKPSQRRFHAAYGKAFIRSFLQLNLHFPTMKRMLKKIVCYYQ